MRARLPRLASVAINSSSSSSSGSNPPLPTAVAADYAWSRPTRSTPEFPTASTSASSTVRVEERGRRTGSSQLAKAVLHGQQRADESSWAERARGGAEAQLQGGQQVPRTAGSQRTKGKSDNVEQRRATTIRTSSQFPVAGPSRLRLDPIIPRTNEHPPSAQEQERAQPPPASPSRRSRTSHLETLSLPTTEPELYDFLRRAKTAYASLPAEWLASFHSHANLADLVSSRTYRFLLRVAFDASNLRLVRALIAEVKERGLVLDEITKRAVLRGYAGLGPRLRREDEAIRTALVEELGRTAGVVRPTKRRNFGQTGKGLNDLDELWKGWAVRGRDRRLREQVDALLSVKEAAPTALPSPSRKGNKGVSSSPRARANLRPHTATVSTPMQRIALSCPPILIPPFAHTLPGSDISALVQSLVGAGRRDEAFHLAETWLAENRPVFAEPPASPRPPDPPPSHLPAATRMSSSTARRSTSLSVYLRQAASYHSTAVVLLNVLLKPLFLERASMPDIRSFVASFVETHSALRPAPPLTPDVVTLRTLITGVLGSPTAWDRATSLVDWFGYQWGIPLADPCTNERHRFLPPNTIEGDRLAVEPPSAAGKSATRAIELARTEHKELPQLLLVKPHSVVPPDIALLLLRHAADQYSRGLFAQSTNRRRVWRQGIRAWWRAFDKGASSSTRMTTDVWTGQKARSVMRKAVKVGLFKPKELVRRGRTRSAEDEGDLEKEEPLL
ncbi:hypothetical protein JCM10908_002835 [Rhodotorula pacifica]|uniref:uncharacterized protein n=1 Tax=Rhodotorula pacifica TaxID=1495444 RepID=UPI0031811CD5